MNSSINAILIIGSLLLFVSILTSKLSARTGVPTILVFILIGMLAGSDGLGGISFDNYKVANVLGSITITLILFLGGLDTNFNHIRPVIWSSILLSTVGVLITTFSIGFFIHYVTDLSMLQGLLMGSIISSTDAAAVFSILRSKNINLKYNLAPTLEIESGSNDVMAYFLTVFFMLMISTGGKDIGLSTAFYTFLKEMLIGGILGVVIGKLLVLVMNKAHLTYESLYPGLALSIILFSYSFANYLNGSGFLAVYIAGLVLGRHDFLHKKSLIKFYDGVTWLMQVIMFVVLGLLVYPKRLIPIAGSGILISMVLMFIARPLGVFLSLAFFKSINIRQKLFISWGGLRGAAPVVFAIYPLISGFEKADVIFHLIFFIVITSVLLQGTTLYPLAKVLDLEDLTYLHHPNSTSSINDIKSYSSNELIEIVINVDSPIVGNKIVDLGFPQNSMIILIYRDGVYITPHGGTILEAMDRLTIISPDKVELQLVEKCLCVSSINIMSQHS